MSSSSTDPTIPTTPLSTLALQQLLQQLQQQSQQQSAQLTQKLATSQSGQNLLHIGSSLSTLPPDLHLLLTSLHPLLQQSEATEKSVLAALQKLVQAGLDLKHAMHRVESSRQCAELVEELAVCERIVQEWKERRNLLKKSTTTGKDRCFLDAK
jgi:hypothetical protein